MLAYAQFLEAYKRFLTTVASDRLCYSCCIGHDRDHLCILFVDSVMLSSMASSFGITTALLDAELSRFIAAGRLNAKIDKVGDIIETSRPDKKNAQYQDIIKKGDLLLNQVQKLVRAIDI